MKERQKPIWNNNSRRKSDRWCPDYPTDGTVDFSLNGYVQKIKEDGNNEVDYLTFYLMNPVAQGNICSIGVTASWDLPQVEVGDHINVFGVMRSWYNDGNVKLELIAQQIEEIKEDEKNIEESTPTKTRRGTLKANDIP